MLKIDNRIISLTSNPLIIPEIGINHKGNLNLAFKIVDAANRAGAEIIKHQTHTIDDEMSEEAKKIRPGNSKNNIFSIIKNNSLSAEEEFKLFKYVKSKKMIYLSTPFSRNAVDRLIKFGVSAFKIGSGEMSNYPLLEYVSKFSKPLIVSTGLHNLKQVKKTYNFLNKKKMTFAFLHTTNIYPTSDKYLRLNSIKQLQKEFPKTIIGLSDHTGDPLSAIIGISLGAKIIEKHFIINKNIKGPDISSSINEKQLKELIINSKRITPQMNGNKNKLLDQEEVTRRFAFTSVVSIREINKGEKFSSKNLFVMRPGTGYFGPSKLSYLYGKIAKKNIKKRTQIKKNDFK
jgi:N-acetylneuraminate synthase